MTQTSEPTIGMMEGAFFVSKNALLKWVNNLLGTAVGKVEDCANGAVYCRVLAALYPHKVSLKRVNNGAKLEYEFLNNYKVLQKAFDDCGIKKHIEVDKLIRGKFQDNLEFLQWLKSFYEKAAISNSGADQIPARSKDARREVTERTSPAVKENSRHEEWEMRRERDFFLNKLQHIEVVTNGETDPGAAKLVKQIQHILFNPEFI